MFWFSSSSEAEHDLNMFLFWFGESSLSVLIKSVLVRKVVFLDISGKLSYQKVLKLFIKDEEDIKLTWQRIQQLLVQTVECLSGDEKIFYSACSLCQNP